MSQPVKIYWAGYMVSLFVLILAIIFMGYLMYRFPSLRCMRNCLHCNLILTFILYIATWVLFGHAIRAYHHDSIQRINGPSSLYKTTVTSNKTNYFNHNKNNFDRNNYSNYTTSKFGGIDPFRFGIFGTNLTDNTLLRSQKKYKDGAIIRKNLMHYNNINSDLNDSTNHHYNMGATKNVPISITNTSPVLLHSSSNSTPSTSIMSADLNTHNLFQTNPKVHNRSNFNDQTPVIIKDPKTIFAQTTLPTNTSIETNLLVNKNVSLIIGEKRDIQNYGNNSVPIIITTNHKSSSSQLLWYGNNSSNIVTQSYLKSNSLNNYKVRRRKLDQPIDNNRTSAIRCGIVTLIYYYMNTVTHCSMLAEGIFLFLLIFKGFEYQHVLPLKFYMFLGWIVPFIAVVIIAFVQKTKHISDFCALNKLFHSFAYVCVFSLLLNFLIFVAVLCVVIRKCCSPIHVKGNQKGLFFLIPLLGVFHLGTMLQNFAFVKDILAPLALSFQGFMVALYCCFLNKEIKDAISTQYNIWRIGKSHRSSSNNSTLLTPLSSISFAPNYNFFSDKNNANGITPINRNRRSSSLIFDSQVTRALFQQLQSLRRPSAESSASKATNINNPVVNGDVTSAATAVDIRINPNLILATTGAANKTYQLKWALRRFGSNLRRLFGRLLGNNSELGNDLSSVYDRKDSAIGCKLETACNNNNNHNNNANSVHTNNYQKISYLPIVNHRESI